MPVDAESYVSPTLVLLAFDWPQGRVRTDFLGFAIRRNPGFRGAPESWLPNRIDFDGPAASGEDKPSNRAPIQKFMWWDARIDTEDRGKTFKYWIAPVLGSPSHFDVVAAEALEIDVEIPELETNGVGTYFNRAVMSSQAFARHFPKLDTPARERAALDWLANGIEEGVPDFLAGAKPGHGIFGAIYHFNDEVWLVPAFKKVRKGGLSLVYNSTSKDTESDESIAALVADGHAEDAFFKRTRANISHNKFLTLQKGETPKRLLMGSANFTTAALTRQANVLHTFNSPELAKLYFDRAKLLAENPTLDPLSQEAGWSDPVTDIPGAEICAFFAPEKKPSRMAIDRVATAVRGAESSVIFCCFMPTDMPLIEACLEQGDAGRMMFGLVDKANEPSPNDNSYEPKLALYHRSRDQKDVAGREAFNGDWVPDGFANERKYWPREVPTRAVRIHHKFVLIDGETDDPILYTGSANLSNNSQYKNDENLLEIRGHKGLARAYLAEFLRIYEHYRARLAYVRSRASSGENREFRLAPNADWARKHFTPDAPEWKARRAMVGRWEEDE